MEEKKGKEGELEDQEAEREEKEENGFGNKERTNDRKKDRSCTLSQ